MCRCAALMIGLRPPAPAQLVMARGQLGKQRLEAEPARVRLEPGALQRADRIAERDHVRALRAVGTERLHGEQHRAAELVLLGGVLQLGQHAGLGQIAAGRLRRAARRLPQRDRHVVLERIEHGRQAVQQRRDRGGPCTASSST